MFAFFIANMWKKFTSITLIIN